MHFHLSTHTLSWTKKLRNSSWKTNNSFSINNSFLFVCAFYEIISLEEKTWKTLSCVIRIIKNINERSDMRTKFIPHHSLNIETLDFSFLFFVFILVASAPVIIVYRNVNNNDHNRCVWKFLVNGYRENIEIGTSELNLFLKSAK